MNAFERNELAESGIPTVISFFDAESNTFSYVVRDPSSRACAIVDSVMNFDYASGTTSFEGADIIANYVKEEKLAVEWILETHVHADHLSAAPYLQKQLGGKLAISEKVVVVQEVFGKAFNEGTDFERDGSQFDVLFKDDEDFSIGGLRACAKLTPGHTPACMTYLIGDAAFVGDTLFMPDSGSARADFPGGSAVTLFDSVQKILTLPESTRLFLCHDYAESGRELQCETNVVVQKKENIHFHTGISKQQFVDTRNCRDKTLEMPRLILPSLQINMRAGHLPPEEANETRYLKIPLNYFPAGN